ncbi:hypothetical protein CPC08DRAFT_708384 [Agrocybe pediades]|nr:hypothetical protein CPC08DRAFT_708384 [Agrocybe pediades]
MSSDPLKAHLLAFLNVYKNGTAPGESILAYDGPTDPATEEILRSLDEMATRMHSAEKNLKDVNERSAAIEKELDQLKADVQNIEHECRAIASGDITRTAFTDPVKSPIAFPLMEEVNFLLSHLRQLITEISRVCHEMVAEGKLGGQCLVVDFGEVEAPFNLLAARITSQIRSISKVMRALSVGDLSKQVEVESYGEQLDLKNSLNKTVIQTRVLVKEIGRVVSEIENQGKITVPAHVAGAEGQWETIIEQVNRLAQLAAKE